MVQNSSDTVVQEEELDARLVELLRIMQREHMAEEEVEPG